MGMNREIKFRGLGVHGKWAYGLLSISQGHEGQPEPGYYISNSAGMPWAYKVIPESVGQWTGMEDTNGSLIFEGDIVSVYGEIRVVEFKNAFWWVDLKAGRDELDSNSLGGFGTETKAGHKPLYRYPRYQLEVIGSIHTHPQLLEKQKV
jgi:hypothetical protein